MKKFYQEMKVGVLGGGQLGRMLAQAAVDLDVCLAALDPEANAPVRSVCPRFTQGRFTDFDTVMAFGQDKDLITIEIENVNTAALKALQKQGKTVFPQPEVIELIQDKGRQKQFLADNGFPTAPFVLLENGQTAAESGFELPAMLKLRRGGYDGRGVMKVTPATPANELFDAPCVLEQLVNVKQEISVIAARNARGETRCFPPVEMAFHPEKHLVEFLFMPANLSEKIQSEAEALALALAEKLGIVGLLAVEMFVDPNDRVLINEMAPRTHNSGHHTIEACYTSQFEQHLRAILGLPLGSTRLKSPAVMVNLLGAEGFEGAPVYRGAEEALGMEGVKFHLYGKNITKPFRKMGHITVLAPTLEEAVEKAHRVKDILQVEA